MIDASLVPDPVIEGVDPPTLAAKVRTLDAATKHRTRDEGAEADALIERQGYALRWYRGVGVLVHATREAWSSHQGVPLVAWLARQGVTLGQWRAG